MYNIIHDIVPYLVELRISKQSTATVQALRPLCCNSTCNVCDLAALRKLGSIVTVTLD